MNESPQSPMPWPVTPKQASVMDAICEFGSTKGAARKLGMPSATVDQYRLRVKNAMGARTVLAACIAWDRWRRGAK